MSRKKKTEITAEALISDGWIKKSDNPVFPIQKVIENRNPLNDDDEDTGVKLVVHGMYNNQQFAVCFPDGGLLNFSPSCMEDLKSFEKLIDFYDCPY